MSRRSETRRVIKQIRADDRRLTTWMVDNFSILIREYGSGRLDLRELSKVVRTLGLTNDHGGPLSEATISKTWARVRGQMAEAAAPQPPAMRTFPPGIVALATPDSLAGREGLATAASAFRKTSVAPRAEPVIVPPHVAPSSASPPCSAPSLPAAGGAAPAGLSADEQIARFRRDQRVGTRPMPGTIEIPIKR